MTLLDCAECVGFVTIVINNFLGLVYELQTASGLEWKMVVSIAKLAQVGGDRDIGETLLGRHVGFR